MSSSHVVAAVPCRVPTNPATLAPGAVHITDSPMTLGPVAVAVGASLNLAAPGLSLSPSLRAACVCPPACVDVLRASLSERLGSRPSLRAARVNGASSLHSAARTWGPKGDERKRLAVCLLRG